MATKTSRKKSNPTSTTTPAGIAANDPTALTDLTEMDREEALQAILRLEPMLKVEVLKCETEGDAYQAVERRMWSSRVGPVFEFREKGEVSLKGMFNGVFASRDLRSDLIRWEEISNFISREALNEDEPGAEDEPDESEFEARHPDEPRANEHGVLDVDVQAMEIRFPKSHKSEASIILAEDSGGRWRFGTDYKFGTGGGGWLPRLHDDSFANRSQAIAGALDTLLEVPGRHHAESAARDRWHGVLTRFREDWLQNLPPGEMDAVRVTEPAAKAAPPADPIAETVADVAPPTWTERTVPIASITVREGNQRQLFEDEETLELAETIRQHGLINPPSVRAILGHAGKVETVGYELMAGERRLRACKLLGWEMIRVCVSSPIDDRQADEVRLIENLQRKDLSAIEEANGFDAMIAHHGYTQAELAKRLGCTQPHIANRLRLRKLPADWQQRIISQEIPPTHARYVLPYAEYPTILAALEEEFFTSDDAQGVGTVLEFSELVQDVVLHVTRDVHAAVYSQRLGRIAQPFKPTSEQLEQLQVIEIGEKVVAVNAELWDQLQAAWIDSLVEQQGELPEQSEFPMGSESVGPEDASEEEQGAGDATDETPAENDTAAAPAKKKATAAERRALEQAEADAKRERLEGWRANWLRMLLAERCQTDFMFGMRALVMLLASPWEMPDSVMRVADLLEKEPTSDGCSKLGKKIARFDRPTEVLHVLVPTWFWDEGEPQMIFPNEAVEALAEAAAINLTVEWSKESAGPLTEAFYNMHSQAELVAFGEKLGMPCLNEYTKSQLVTALYEAPDNDLLPDGIREVAVLKAPSKKPAGDSPKKGASKPR